MFCTLPAKICFVVAVLLTFFSIYTAMNAMGQAVNAMSKVMDIKPIAQGTSLQLMCEPDEMSPEGGDLLTVMIMYETANFPDTSCQSVFDQVKITFVQPAEAPDCVERLGYTTCNGTLWNAPTLTPVCADLSDMSDDWASPDTSPSTSPSTTASPSPAENPSEDREESVQEDSEDMVPPAEATEIPPDDIVRKRRLLQAAQAGASSGYTVVASFDFHSKGGGGIDTCLGGEYEIESQSSVMVVHLGSMVNEVNKVIENMADDGGVLHKFVRSIQMGVLSWCMGCFGCCLCMMGSDPSQSSGNDGTEMA